MAEEKNLSQFDVKDIFSKVNFKYIKNKCYYGISLKKKKKDSSADPPMINKSVKSLLEELGQAELAEEFYGARGDYFGGQILKQIKNGGALAGSKINGMEKVDLFATIIKHPIKSQTDWVNLMDIKEKIIWGVFLKCVGPRIDKICPCLGKHN